MKTRRGGWEGFLHRMAMALAALFAAAGGAAAQLIPQSGEIQINTYTALNQTAPAIAADASGNFVVVWEQQDDGGMPDDITARLFDSSGAGLGPDFQVNLVTADRQRSPAVGRSSTGGFVVAWSSRYQDGDLYGIFARRYDSAGDAQATEFQVTTYTTGSQTLPRLAMGSGGDFVVVWTSLQDGSAQGVFGRRFDASGTAIGGEFQVNTYTTNAQQSGNVFRKSDGSFIVTWSSDGQDGSSQGAFARRFSSDGVAIGGEFQLSTYTSLSQGVAAVAFDPSGGFVATWPSQQDGSSFGIFGRRFDAGGAPLATEFQINVYTTSHQVVPFVVATGGGSFVVAWDSDSQDGDTYGVFGRAFGANGLPRGDETQLSITSASSQRFPKSVVRGQNLVVVWQSGNQDGQFNGIFGRLFSVALTLDVDGNGAVEALTDAILILRYAFGFRGATLITGAVAGNCTRCDAVAIEAYLEQI